MSEKWRLSNTYILLNLSINLRIVEGVFTLIFDGGMGLNVTIVFRSVKTKVDNNLLSVVNVFVCKISCFNSILQISKIINLEWCFRLKF